MRIRISYTCIYNYICIYIYEKRVIIFIIEVIMIRIVVTTMIHNAGIGILVVSSSSTVCIAKRHYSSAQDWLNMCSNRVHQLMMQTHM